MRDFRKNVGPVFTVCICTRNRVKYLGAAIESVLAQEVSVGAFEILVVDNGSTDGTSEMVQARFGADTRASVRCIREEVAGLSRARNRAIAETTGEFILFLDDDAIAEPGWLQAMINGFSVAEGIESVGGAVVPVFEEDLPPWLAARVTGIFSPQMPAPGAQLVTYPKYPYGANLAFHRSVFTRAGLFREDLGYRGDSCLMPADETELLLRIEKSGGLILYEPRAIVRHLIPASRTGRNYLRARYFAVGQGHYELEKTRRHDVESWGFRQILKGWSRGVRSYFSAWSVIRATRRATDGGAFDRELTARIEAGRAASQIREAGKQFKARLFRGKGNQ